MNNNNKKGSDNVGIVAYMKILESKFAFEEFKAMEPALKNSFSMIAKQLRIFYEALLTEGFTREEAFQIINTQSMAMLNPNIFGGGNTQSDR
ncbi:hypothetical protein [Clostridium lundense]|uniref:hypothetical protein n=1 Tax=Clostridium lundense TaxID=319475 RepID=UPI000487D496|nr:hypothetical protein [Clostridium lundense]